MQEAEKMIITGDHPVNGPRKDLTGKRFGRLVVIRCYGRRGRVYLWECVCDCGNTTTVCVSNLKRKTKSCGCLASELRSARMTAMATKHGLSRTTEYKAWYHMWRRCTVEKDEAFKWYGGRGIKVCERWKDLKNFIDDMGKCPNGMTLERRDNDGNYSPENCYWATLIEQQNNTRNNVRLTILGKTKTVAQWSRESGINPHTIYKRISKYGFSHQDAVFKPVEHQVHDLVLPALPNGETKDA